MNPPGLQDDGTLYLETDDDGDGHSKSLSWIAEEPDTACLEGFFTADELEAIARHMRQEQGRMAA